MTIEPAVLRVLREIVREEIRTALRELPDVAAAGPVPPLSKPALPAPPKWALTHGSRNVVAEVQRIRAAIAKEQGRRP